MTEEIENIIKNTEFDDLTTSQINQIKEFASSKEDFNGLKMVLLGVNYDKSEEMQTSENVKNRLDVLFEATYGASVEKVGFWTKVGAFLWPAGKTLFAKPVVQFASICLICVLGYTIVNQSNFGKTEVAVNSSEKNLEVKNKEKLISPILKEEESVIDHENEGKDTEVTELVAVEESVEQVKPASPLKFDIKPNRNLNSDSKRDDEVSFNLLDANHPDLMLEDVAPVMTTPTISGFVDMGTEAVTSEYKDNSVASLESRVELYTKASENNSAVLDLLTPLF